MSDPKQQPEAEFDRIDADAVCEACGTVNPEETLFCKSCGNNLRDQRVNRITDGRGIEELAADTAPPAQWLSKALTVLGILLVIWSAINVANGNIEKWLTSTEHSLVSGPSPARLWKGLDGDVYDALAKQIAEHTITVDEINAAGKAAPQGPEFEGLYFLKNSSAANGAMIGQAAVKEEGGRVFFVAKLSRGAEIRGELDVSAANPKTVSAGMKVGKQILPAYGMAQKLQDGVFACYGQQNAVDEETADADTPTVSAVAYRLPPT